MITSGEENAPLTSLGLLGAVRTCNKKVSLKEEHRREGGPHVTVVVNAWYSKDS